MPDITVIWEVAMKYFSWERGVTISLLMFVNRGMTVMLVNWGIYDCNMSDSGDLSSEHQVIMDSANVC